MTVRHPTGTCMVCDNGGPATPHPPYSASLLLIDPKFPHNVAAALRNASCFGFDAVYWTGTRVTLDAGLGQRLPREERMKAYKDVDLVHLGETARPIQKIARDHAVVPVAVELLPSTESLHEFVHPWNALYVFGPEDGSLPKGIRHACYRFVSIPTFHCLNLALATGIVAWDRTVKVHQAEGMPMPSLDGETRGVWHTSALEMAR